MAHVMIELVQNYLTISLYSLSTILERGFPKCKKLLLLGMGFRAIFIFYYFSLLFSL